MSNIVVFGASGQLGQCLKTVANARGLTSIFFPSETDANILDKEALKKIFDTYKPSWCINCAAYTAVDKAEDEIDLARKINKTGAENISELCLEYNSVFIHTSTDFVFRGDKATPLDEEDVAEPINIYGLTKLEGEQAVTNKLKKFFILRTSWLYSEYGNNFVKTMMRLGSERDELKVIADQIGTPTYAMDLAECILNIISNESTAYGLYHYSNEGVASWYDFAKAIFDILGSKIKVLPIKTSEYPTRAERPAYSVMSKAKIKETFNIEIPYWRDSLITCISKL
ncbi:dTDP-4-dehydrorhamnose reductase [Mucilaginibacter sp. BT774]|uniref:dTDP-4-dehydrorhamnose reductase n=1 Tax=Mucilaginibacter sp. BT774 TaxID=3062276 RepID=UPI0026754BF7|nr:dTDP-4-dehydrorhamnose reductase [Mucilaginibacter sp. BT774]MDO3625946.1 dTDP-4-dehydrorhamnose reductase [Mucilaginibacter sp. BT774]